MDTHSNFIPNIYEFCNGWCERCPFTARCRNYHLQTAGSRLADGAATQTRPADPTEALVAQLTEALHMTKDYLERLKLPAPPDAPVAGAAERLALEEQAAARQRAKEQRAAQLAREYLRLTGQWLDTEADLLETAGFQQRQAVDLGLRSEDDALTLLNTLKDAWDTLKWYRTLIPVKTTSALRAVAQPTTDVRLLDYYNGKAKLVLVSIDHSLAAWQTLMQHYPEKIDDLLDLLSLLSQLRREVESVFPQARQFCRPGLDGLEFSKDL